MEISNGRKYDISIIIPNYKSEVYLKNNLESVYGWINPQINGEIIIVNNDESEDLEKIKKEFPNVGIINHKKNVGFGAACNLGAKTAKGRYLLFLNPDCEIISKKAGKIINEMESDGNIGILGGQLIDGNGKIQKWCAGAEANLLNLFRNNLGFSKSCDIWKNKAKIEADWVSGTAMFLKKELFEKICGFDENFFMYFEDMDICRRIRKDGKKIIYFPEFKIKHLGGRSYKNEKIQKKHYYDSQEYYFEKHCGKIQASMLKFARKILFY